MTRIIHEPFTLFGVRWAPLFVPWKQRMETLAVLQFVFTWLVLPIMSLWVPVYLLLFTPFWPIMLAYLIYMYFDWNTPSKGGRAISLYQKWSIWKHFRDYFPIRLIKTADLPTNKNYIFGSHPHGVLSVGIFSNMLTCCNDFREVFPGLEPTILTLNGQFWFPMRREIGIASGGVDCSHSSIRHMLENPGKGRAIAIVLGGAAEALDAHPGKHELNLLSRRGFCKYAIQYGADLVPVYNFGENDLYKQNENERGSRLRAVQGLIKRTIGFCPPLMQGRGMFNYSFGILPHRKPVTTVIGAPIHVTQVFEPTRHQIDVLHSKYVAALNDLFEAHKHLHNIPDDVHLNIY